jgi:hypothetical protein
MLAALNLGHFGVKLHAPDDVGATWQEVATPAYPPRPENDKGVPWKLGQIWSPEAAHGTVWAGTLPRGLFRSADFGVSWNPVDSLWSRTERVEWFGGGYDVPGIQSICPHPPHAGEVRVGISCGGAWCSLAGSWQSLRLCAVLSMRPWRYFSGHSNFRCVRPKSRGHASDSERSDDNHDLLLNRAHRVAAAIVPTTITSGLPSTHRPWPQRSGRRPPGR